jgi:CubicO group peptidase (beta-lactamase class C family)
MRAGFLWDESSAPYGDPRNSTFQLASSSNWIKYMLDLPMSDPPGSRFRYNSGCSILLSGILRSTTGVSADAFCRENLFGLLGIADYQWETGPQGITNTGWGLSLRPRDMLKFGTVFLNRGIREGRSVVPGSWIDQSTNPAVTLSGGYSYGYQWWLLPLGNVLTHTPLPNDIKFAWGYGGQFIFVIPSLNMVVVSTAGNYTGDDSQAIRFLQEYIARAAE